MDRAPETRASTLHFLYRQLFVKASPLSRHDADMEDTKATLTIFNVWLGLETSCQLLDLQVKVIVAMCGQSNGREACQQLFNALHLCSDSMEGWKLELPFYDSTTEFIIVLRTCSPST